MMLTDIDAPSQRAAIEAALVEWLPQQRWFGAKDRRIDRVAVQDAAELSADPPLLLLFVEVLFADGHVERYQVPLTRGEAAVLPGTDLVDALSDDRATTALATSLLGGGEQRTAGGATLRSRAPGGQIGGLGPPKRLGVEQSNSSVVFGDERILKVFRRLEPGVNPDVEVTAALTEAGFAHVPAQRGSAELVADGEVTALAVLADFVAGAREGWAVAVEEVAGVAEGGMATSSPLLPLLGALGEVVGAMHVTLAGAFGAEPADDEQVKAWVARMHDQADRVLATAERLAADVTAPIRARADSVHERLDALTAAAGGALVRIHGDLHLGQVLLDRDGVWQILDFEGEPVRTLAERRARSFPLRDVAGMLRSFDYAAATAAGGGEVPEAVASWRAEARRRFLDGYAGAMGDGGLLPEDPGALSAQLRAFELDKAVYELGYELANRPSWVPIPVGGILRVLDGEDPGRPEENANSEERQT